MSDKYLFQNQTADGNTDPILADFSDEECELIVWGTFDGATVKLQMTPDEGTTWIDVRDLGGVVISLTTNRVVPLSVSYNEKLRANISGAGASTDLTSVIRRVGRG